MTCITRFAPSPTGHLHIGHAASALFAWEQAAAENGLCLLRIEDIDQTRCKPQFTDDIYNDLHWLGFDWPKPARVQSDHFADYDTVLKQLEADGLLYRCFCSRKDIAAEIAAAGGAPHGLDGALYPRSCTRLSAHEVDDKLDANLPYAWRLDMAKAVRRLPEVLRWHDRGKGWQSVTRDFLLGRIGDVVLARKDCPASYHLCVTHDDALQEVSLVTRGIDLFDATHLQVFLQFLCGWPTPDYHHHSLLLDNEGKRFAKRNDSVTLAQLRIKGITPDAVLQAIKDRNWSHLIAE